MITYSSCQPQIWLLLSDSKLHEVQITCVLKAPLRINLEKLNYFGVTTQRGKKKITVKNDSDKDLPFSFRQLEWSFLKSYMHSSSEFLFLFVFPSSGFSHILFLTHTRCLLKSQKCIGSLHLLPSSTSTLPLLYYCCSRIYTLRSWAFTNRKYQELLDFYRKVISLGFLSILPYIFTCILKVMATVVNRSQNYL